MRMPLVVALALVVLRAVAGAEIVAAGPVFRVSTYTTLDQIGRGPVVCRGDQGAFVIVWDDAAGSGTVYGQRFDSAGDRLGTEFRVDTYTTDGKTTATAAGKSAAPALPALGLTPLVEAQLQVGAGGACFAGTFAAPSKNTPALFHAKGD